MNVLEAKADGGHENFTRDFTKLPSLTCPDCPAYDYSGTNATQSYISYPFHVDATKNSHPMFPTLNGTLDRQFIDRCHLGIPAP